MPEELIGIIGGTGLGDELARHMADEQFEDVKTPFGKPSTSIIVGRMGQRKIAFLNRHGQGHKLSPSEIPFAANIFALKKLGVRTIIASGAVGSLREEIAPGQTTKHVLQQIWCGALRDGPACLPATCRGTCRNS